MKSKDITSVRIEQEVRLLLNILKKRHRYSNVSDLIYDMSNFFEVNEVSPRSLKEPVAKKLSAFREALFAKLGAHERDYFKAHYHDFNLVSGYLKEELDSIKKMLSDKDFTTPKSIENGEEKSAKNQPNNIADKSKKTAIIFDDPAAEKAKKLSNLNYVLDLFETKLNSKGNKYEVDKNAFSEFKMSLVNVVTR